jgi:hypothetical protein
MINYAPKDEFKTLYSIFTAHSDSIGAKLTRLRARQSTQDPLIVATGSDVVIFPGDGKPPTYESFRLTTRGFVELTSVSHLGVAVPYLARLRELGDASWREDARRLIETMQAVRRVNTETFWRDQVAVAAWRGRETKIADLVEYACETTTKYLRDCLQSSELLSFEHLRDNYLEPLEGRIAVPINDMMVATFALVFLDIAHRIIGWLRSISVDWERAMVVISGQAGRPTAGLTWATNNMCHLIWKASAERLPTDRLYVAPFGPSLSLSSLADARDCATVENEYRQLWFSSRASVEVAREMFKGYPAFRPATSTGPLISASTRWLTELPTLRSYDDRLAAITRLRFVMEDPAQQLSNASAHFIIDALCHANNDPLQVSIPGFTDIDYRAR